MIVWKTRTKATVKTSLGDMELHIKKKYKGANGYNIFVDGRDTGLFELTISDARDKAREYVSGWK